MSGVCNTLTRQAEVSRNCCYGIRVIGIVRSLLDGLTSIEEIPYHSEDDPC